MIIDLDKTISNVMERICINERCPRGHVYSYTKNGKRRCIQCERLDRYMKTIIDKKRNRSSFFSLGG